MVKEVNFSEMTIEQYVNRLYKETERDQVLRVWGWDSNADEDLDQTFYSCKMNWTEEKSRELATACSQYVRNVEACAEALKKPVDTENLKAVFETLGVDLYAFWNTYLRPFKQNVGIGSFEDDNSIASKNFCREELTPEEQETYDAHVKDTFAQARERVGENNFAYDLLIRSMRYARLFSIGAPSVVLDNEKRILIEAFLFFHCATHLEVIESFPTGDEEALL